MLAGLRALGLLAGGLVGWRLGESLVAQPSDDLLLAVVLITTCAGLGAVLAPFLTFYPLLWTRREIEQASAASLIAAGLGLTGGLLLAALLVAPLALLPAPFSQFLPAVSAAVLGYLGVATAVARRADFVALIRQRSAGQSSSLAIPRGLLLDSSAIIDGRIAEVSQTGFLDGELLVPRFVLEEVQHIADAGDVLRRNRGRRGLEILNRLQKSSRLPVRVIEHDLIDGQAVDAGLVRLAREDNHAIITNDYNLNRVAELQGVVVLNLNDLATAIRSTVLPGEELDVLIVQEGKEPGQGVAYLDDGTIIVVDQGRAAVGGERRVVVTRVLQTATGRMIFATLREPGGAPTRQAREAVAR